MIWLDLDPTLGHEQRGHRPALVLSPAAYQRKSGLCLVCPITNTRRGYPFEVVLPAGGPVTGVILADQIRALAWAERNAKVIGTAPAAVCDDVRAKLAALLGI